MTAPRLIPLMFGNSQEYDFPVKDVAFVLDAQRTTVENGKIAAFNTNAYGTISQANTAQRAESIAGAPHGYKGNVARFHLDLQSHYALPSMASWNAGEIFAVITSTYSYHEYSVSNFPSGYHTGLWHLGTFDGGVHYTWGSQVIDNFGCASFRGTYSLGLANDPNYFPDAPHCLNVVRSASGHYMFAADLQAAPASSSAVYVGETAGGTVGFPSVPWIGRTLYDYWFCGLLSMLVICRTNQSSQDRNAMYDWLQRKCRVGY